MDSFMHRRASLVAQMVKICLQWGRPAFYPWVEKIPWWRAWQPIPIFLPGELSGTEEPGRLQSMGYQRVGHDWVAKCVHTHTHTHTQKKPDNIIFQSLEQPRSLPEQEGKCFFNPTHHGLSAFSFCLFMLSKLLFQSSCPWKAHLFLGSIMKWLKAWIQQPKYQSPNICFVLVMRC